MLKVEKEQKGETLYIKLIGLVDEYLDFYQSIGPFPKEAIINCKEVERLNSAGVKSWIRYFEEAVQYGSQLKFTECSVQVVEQINLIVNFLAGGKVESVYLPFACTSCKKNFVLLMAVDRLRQIRDSLPNPNCPKCGSVTAFDEFEDEYFNFLKRS